MPCIVCGSVSIILLFFLRMEEKICCFPTLWWHPPDPAPFWTPACTKMCSESSPARVSGRTIIGNLKTHMTFFCCFIFFFDISVKLLSFCCRRSVASRVVDPQHQLSATGRVPRLTHQHWFWQQLVWEEQRQEQLSGQGRTSGMCLQSNDTRSECGPDMWQNPLRKSPPR